MAGGSLRIVHCVRSPVGGIFRHIVDLATAQTEAGHAVGVICDSTTGGAFEDAAIARLAPRLSLGVTRVPMARSIRPGDLAAALRVLRLVAGMRPDILHGHGAKGGAYARVIGTLLRRGGRRVARLYCPHGGSLHYDPASREGRVYFRLERLLERATDRLVFVSDYERRTYAAKVGAPRVPWTLAYNGLAPEEWTPVLPQEPARDVLFIGMLRDLKGPDVFIEAIGRLAASGRPTTAVVVGDGPDRDRYRATVAARGLESLITFHDPMPAREAFALARVVAVPSRAESMPYIVLETIAAARPLLATAVGGIPEIFGPAADRLLPPGDAAALAEAIARKLADPAEAAREADALRAAIRPRFSLDAMAATVERAYRQALGEATPQMLPQPAAPPRTEP